MAGVVIFVISSSILDYMIILFVLLMETTNVYVYFHLRKIEHHEDFLTH
jgi:hypothetical protein